MRVILFSRPDLFEGEADMIIAMMERGLETLHLRKPDAADERIEQLLRAIPPRLRNRIVLHSAFPLAEPPSAAARRISRADKPFVPLSRGG